MDAVTLFGYAEAEVQQGLMAQLERYEQTEEREGAEAAEKQREMDYAEAVANLEVAIFSARNHMRKADARADRGIIIVTMIIIILHCQKKSKSSTTYMSYAK